MKTELDRSSRHASKPVMFYDQTDDSQPIKTSGYCQKLVVLQFNNLVN